MSEAIIDSANGKNPAAQKELRIDLQVLPQESAHHSKGFRRGLIIGMAFGIGVACIGFALVYLPGYCERALRSMVVTESSDPAKTLQVIDYTTARVMQSIKAKQLLAETIVVSEIPGAPLELPSGSTVARGGLHIRGTLGEGLLTICCNYNTVAGTADFSVLDLEMTSVRARDLRTEGATR